MSLSTVLKKSLFAKVDNVVCDLQTGTLAIKVEVEDSDSIVSFTQQENGQWSLNQNPLAELCIPVPGFAIRTPICQLNVGDIVLLSDDTMGFFVEKLQDEKLDNPVIKIVSAKTGRLTDVSISSNRLLGNHGVLAVKNFFGQCKDKGISSLLPMLLMGDGKQDDLLMMMMMMGDNKNNNMMLPLLLSKMGGEKNNKDLLMMMMLTNNGSNDMSAMLPFLSNFGNCGKNEIKPVINKKITSSPV
jgi:hypothetical protein